MTVRGPVPVSGRHAGARGRCRVLVIDDDLDHRVLMQRSLLDAGYDVAVLADPVQALEELDGVDLVLVDYRLPAMDGVEFLRQARARGADASVVLVTGMGKADVAVEAMQEGAVDFVTKQPGYLDFLPHVIERARRHHDHVLRAKELQRQALLVDTARDRGSLFDEIVGGAMRLLGATSATLYLDEGGGLRPVATSGIGLRDEMIVAPPLPDAGQVAVRDDGALLAALLADPDEPYGLLAVTSPSGERFLDEDRELARTFACFAGIAARNLRRRELESALIEQLQETMQARHDFVASVSHELRTPLTSILGFAELIRGHRERLDEVEQARFMDKIVIHATELEDLVAQLIDLAALERGRPLPRRIGALDLADELEAAVQTSEAILRGRPVHVQATSVAVLADADLLRRTLANLLSNAVKFSEPDSPIRIAASVDGTGARIEVRDHGTGLTPTEAARVFDAFWRAGHSVANAIRGSGIGLALVREYVRAMEGEVGVESEPGVGSRFWFTLPLAPVSLDGSPR